MKLNRIKIVNFRNHADTLLNLARLTCVRGPNHSGKSTIGQAIEFALTGRSDATDAAGKGMAGLIRQGADRAGILLDLESNKQVTVNCNLTAKPERTVTISDPNDPTYRGEPVKQWIESQKPVLSCLLNARYFINLKPAEQKSLLASIILRDRYDWPEEIKSKCGAVHISSLIPWDKAPFDVIEAGYKAAFEKRTEINRDIKNHHIPEPVALPDAAGAGSPEELRTRLTGIHTQANALAVARLDAIKGRAKVEGDIRVLETRIASYEARIRQEQETLGTIEVLTAKQQKDLEKTAKGAGKMAELETELASVRAQLSGVSALLRHFDLLDGKNECPTCKREVSDEFLTAAMQPHVEKKNELAIRERELLKEQQGLGDVTGAQRKLDQAKTDETRRKRSQAILAETDALLKSTRGDLEDLQNRTPAPAAADASEEESSLRAQIVELDALVGKVAVADQRAHDIAKAKETLQKLTQAQGTLESLVAYFGKDGVKAQLLAEDIAPFTSAMNEALAGWGYACAFNIEPYGFIVTKLMDGYTAHSFNLEQLSGSERLRFSVAFQVALAQVSGVRMVVVDECDMLDSEGRSAFYELLLSADLDQAIAIGTSEVEEVPDVEGAVFYAMQDGHARLLQPQGVEA